MHVYLSTHVDGDERVVHADFSLRSACDRILKTFASDHLVDAYDNEADEYRDEYIAIGEVLGELLEGKIKLPFYATDADDDSIDILIVEQQIA